MLPQTFFGVAPNPNCECPPRIVSYEGTPDDGDILVYDETTDTWGPAAPNPGDITAVNTTLPLTGGATSGAVTLDINNFTGDSGAGGLDGAVPAPAAGDAAAGKFLKADGTWAVPGGTPAIQSVTYSQLTQQSTNSTALVDIPGMTVNITTTGGKLLILYSDSMQNVSPGANSFVAILVDGVNVQEGIFTAGGGGYAQIITMHFLRPIAAGLHTVKIQFATSAGGVVYSNSTGTYETQATLTVLEV